MAVPTIDQTRQLANLHFAATPAVAIEAAEPHAILDRTVNVLITALAVEQVGIAARCLELTLDYMRTRQQFGRPIGAFQAVQHRCAEMLLRLESARSAAYYAAWTVDGAPAELPRAASLAKSYCSEALPSSLPRHSSSTVVSASPGSTTPICTSSGRKPTRCSSGHLLRTGSCWARSSGSDAGSC